jgi:HSP20 family protein
MELVRWEPFGHFNKLHMHLSDLLEDSFNRLQIATNGSWTPPVDIIEAKDAYIIRAELAGMNKEDINVELNDGTLTLSGERKAEQPAAGAEYRIVERVNGKFVRTVILPKTVNQAGIQASYTNGVLEIRVPKAEEAKPRQITVH